MTDFFDLSEVSPFDPATGRCIRLLKGGGKAPDPAPISPKAEETPQLVGQAQKDDYLKQQDIRGRNRYIIGAQNDESFGNKLVLGG